MSKFRKLTSQLCAIFPYVCLQFAVGTISGFNVVLVAELHKADSEIAMSLDQLSWFASLNIVKIVGTPISGLLCQRFGSRLLVLVVASADFTRLLLYHYSTTATIVIFARALGTLMSIYPLTAPYVSEISEPRYRGTFLAVAQLATNVGMFFGLLLGSILYWRTIALVNLAFPILAIVTVLMTPNSPAWLASKGRLNEAEKSLRWLRGWAKPEQVQIEFGTLVEKSSTTQNDDQTCLARSKNFFHHFLQRSFYRPFGSMCLMLLIYCSTGVTTSETYATVIFRELHSPIDESIATAVMGATGVVGSLAVLLTIRRSGKRKLALLSVVAIGLCQAIVAVAGFFDLRGRCLWIAPIALIVANFANSLGGGTILQMLIGEIFPSSVRYVATSMSFAVKMLGMSMMNKVFLYMVKAVTLPGVFLFFALMNVASLLVYYFLFPETEGRSLREIEDHFKGAGNVEERKG